MNDFNSITPAIRKNMISGMLGMVAKIIDIPYQRRVWVRREGVEVEDFDEYVNSLDSYIDPLISKYDDYHLTIAQKKILEDFDSEFEHFCFDYNGPEEFMDTSDWQRMGILANKVLNEFNFTNSDFT